MKKRASKEDREPEEADRESEFYAGRKKEYNLDIFGFNISELGTSWKYIIFCCLICAVFSVAIFALKKIAEFNKKDPKKKNKKK
jgi:hypothetical protein